jgi:3-methyladenine DNA glycosylase AlkD
VDESRGAERTEKTCRSEGTREAGIFRRKRSEGLWDFSASVTRVRPAHRERSGAGGGTLVLRRIHEARILAPLIGESEKITAAQMERWVRDFNSWDVVDTVCCYLYAYAAPAWNKIYEWSDRSAEFEKRAAFSLAAYLSYKDKSAENVRFERFLSVIEREANDERNFVRKAVNWGLRNIGKRNLELNAAAIQAAERIRRQDSRSARWIAADALRELKSEAVQTRLRKKAG